MTELPRQPHERIRDKLIELYGAEVGSATADKLLQILRENPIPPRASALSERDAILIAYGDHVQEPGIHPLQTLHSFLTKIFRGVINTVHILPFYPYSSDDGFSIIDYRRVDPSLGTWEDIQRFNGDFKLMFDLVLNHASSQSAWFQGFLRDEAPYRDYFVTENPQTDLSLVTRPRTHPLLTPYETSAGTHYLWTTFSADQIDLNYANPVVLLEMINILLFYMQQGADFVRLDAIAYLWKIPGTTCIHLPQTHRVVQLMRDVLDLAAPSVDLVSETNVPHQENLSYFGDGTNEAQLVYNFALPPLILDAFYTGSAEILTKWAKTLQAPSDRTTFFNFTASHDGIGVRPATGLLSAAAIERMLETVIARGGQISYKTNPDGTRSAYEMNITYFDALAIPDEPLDQSVDRFLASQAIMLALAGVPGIYLNSLIGAPNWDKGVHETGRARTINRQKFDLAALTAELLNREARASQVLLGYSNLLKRRHRTSAFHPNAVQRILDLDPAVFAVERIPEEGKSVLALTNVSNKPVRIALPNAYKSGLMYVDDKELLGRDGSLEPYQVVWIMTE